MPAHEPPSWAQEISRERNFATIALLHRFSDGPRETVDDQTWSDLDLDNVFAKIDRTVTAPGQQVLYDQMRTYAGDDAVLRERSRQHELLRRDATLREQIRAALGRLQRPGAEYLAPLLLTPFPTAPWFAWLFFLLSAASLACLVGLLFFHPLLLLALPLALVNAAIYLTYGQRITPYFSGFSQITALFSVADRLSKLPGPSRLPQLTILRDTLPGLTRLRKRLGWLSIDRNATSEIAQTAFAYLNMLFLVDVIVFLRALPALRMHRAKLVDLMTAVGSLDAALSVASYIEGLPIHCTPQFTADLRLQATELYHPLLPQPVGNTLDLAHRSALITGPNMAGKTCFLRTIGLNLVLARTLNLCHAKDALLPRAHVRSAIRREDRLAEGTSYFFAEIKQILDFARHDGRSPQILLIDEIFRGTNTVERIASSVAVLRHLSQTQLVLVTSHDLELQELLGDSFATFHFTDHVTGGQYGFDYRLHPGPVRSRNAIRLLELSGYPAPIVAEATRLAERLATDLDDRKRLARAPDR